MLDKFAKLIGIEPRLAEDALHSERAARHVLTRRGFMGGVAAAMAGASVFSFGEHVPLLVPSVLDREYHRMLREYLAAYQAGTMGAWDQRAAKLPSDGRAVARQIEWHKRAIRQMEEKYNFRSRLTVV